MRRAPFVRQEASLWMALSVAIVASGCTGAPVPVSERDVADYRKAQPAAPPSARPAGQPTVTTSTESKSPASSTPAVNASKPATTVRSGEISDASEEVDWRPETYTVKRGDTLYSIALDHGLDYKELAAWNQLADANVIKVSQQLKLRAPPGWKSDSADSDEVIARPLTPSAPIEPQPLEPPPAPKTQPKGIKVAYSSEAFSQLSQDPTATPSLEPKPAAAEPKAEPRPRPSEVKAAPETKATGEPKPVPAAEPLRPTPVKAESTGAKPIVRLEEKVPDQALQWVWPANGKLLHSFNQGSNPKGVAIRGTAGQPVFATASGKVVYSGSGLRGYGKLIIIKHNNTFLSVYAHNRELLVKEGERVSKGQKIAEMGSTSADGVALHFEIRRLGKPVDPLKFLPQEGAS
jgi:lipoprotein NlpD